MVIQLNPSNLVVIANTVALSLRRDQQPIALLAANPKAKFLSSPLSSINNLFISSRVTMVISSPWHRLVNRRPI
jgi:hypothetical protein